MPATDGQAMSPADDNDPAERPRDSGRGAAGSPLQATAREMFLDRRLVTGGAASRSIFKLESDHQDLVLQLLAKRAGVPNYKIDARAPATRTVDGAGSPYTVEEFDAKGSLATDLTGLSRLISPFTPTDFYTEQYWRRRPMVFRGPARRFTNLLNWRDLNEILSRRDLRAPQLRILEGGRELPASMYEGNNLGVGTRQPEMWATNVSWAQVAQPGTQRCHHRHQPDGGVARTHRAIGSADRREPGGLRNGQPVCLVAVLLRFPNALGWSGRLHNPSRRREGNGSYSARRGAMPTGWTPNRLWTLRPIPSGRAT